MRNLRLARLLLGALLFGAAAQAGAEQWYRSNGAGMVLDYMPSRIAALRHEYCLSIDYIEEPPDHLRAYAKPAYRIELHTLYEQGTESRRQWVFKDAENVTRLVSALAAPSAEPDTEEKPAQVQHRPLGFIEIYNEQNLITEEHEFSADGSERIITYVYKHDVLVKAESRLKKPTPKAPAEPAPQSAEPAEPPTEPALLTASDAAEMVPDTVAETTVSDTILTAETVPDTLLTVTDTYRYSRSHALRSIERTYTESAGEPRLVRFTFPYIGPNSWDREQFITPVTPHTAGFMQDVFMDSGSQTAYTTDARGKLLTETRQDAEGAVQGELRNTWAGDRLESVEWKAGDDERRTEYEYDAAGDRIIERNYTKGVLERTVRREHEQEIEELYMNGAVILRAVWENGRKISEERIRSSHSGER